MSSPSKVIRPLIGCTPDRLRRKVVLPGAVGAHQATVSPRRTSMEMPLRALMRP